MVLTEAERAAAEAETGAQSAVISAAQTQADNEDTGIDLGGDPFERAARRTRRAVVSETSPNPVNVDRPLTQIADDAAYEALEPGTKFAGPDGLPRIKPYAVTRDDEFDSVPEGAQFVDPEGTLRTKPRFEGLDFTTQTLYDMALTPKEKRKILERAHPGKVKESAEGLYVEDEGGVLRRPGAGNKVGSRGAAFATSAAAPVVGSVLGGLGGTAAGALAGPAGAFVAGGAGAAGGGVAGQMFNDMVLQLAGVYDRTPSERTENLIYSGVTSAAGLGVGRGISVVAPTLKEGISAAGAAAPAALRKVLGAGQADLEMAESLAKQGVSVPPSTVFKEAPHLQNLAEVFDPAFHTQNPLKQSIEGFYERKAGDILSDLGAAEFKAADRPSLLEPASAVPTQRAGEALTARAISESAAADATARAAIEARRQALAAGMRDTTAQREAIQRAAEDSRAAAQRLIDNGYNDIQRTADAALRTAQAGHNSGELWQMVGNQLQAVKRGLSERANVMYREADELAEGITPNTSGLPGVAQNFLDDLPENFQSANPNIVRKLRDWAGEMGEDGNWVREPVTPSFSELHNVRSQLRGAADWHTLSSDTKNGTYKFFSRKVDESLRDVESVPELRPAVDALNRADAFYRENMPIFEANQIKAIMRGLEAGEPADPALLYKAIVKEGQTDLTNRIRETVGPNLWAGVRGADLQQMLANSQSIVPGVIDGRAFVREVLDRQRSGLLQAVHGQEVSSQLLRQAQDIEMLAGRLPVNVRPGDTVTQVIARARQAADEAKVGAQRDPLGQLNREMKRIEAEEKRIGAGRSRKDDPLNFLYDETTGAAEAVNKILGSEDMILATATRFGKDSPEFEMLRQVYAQRILQGTMEPGAKLAKISPEVQALIFPGATLDQMQTLAKEMDFLMGAKAMQRGDTAAGMSAMAKVEHPVAGRVVSGVTRMIPGVNASARMALGSYYALVRRMTAENPALFTFMLRGLRGTAEEKQAARAILSAHAQRYGAVGAGASQGAYQGAGEE